MTHTNLRRRRFLKTSALLVSAPLIRPARVWSQASAPSKRLTLGCVGLGIIMKSHLGNFLARDDAQVLAVCDVDTTRRDAAKQRVDAAYAAKTGTTYRGCAAYNDFRELLARPDIDAVVIGTPDHWHAYMAIAAVKAGKDVYCEKPLTHNIHEAIELVKAVRGTNRVFQVGSQQRSSMEVKLDRSTSHFQNFVDAVHTRRRPICDVEIGASSVIACHVMNFGYHYGANLKWDPTKNRFASGGDSRWLTREYRQPWPV